MSMWWAVLPLMAIGIVGYVRFRDAMYPPVLHCAVWAGVLAMDALFGGALDPIPSTVLGFVVLSGVTFSIGSYLATYDLSADEVHHVAHGPPPRIVVTRGLTLISLAGLPLFVMRALAIGADGPTENVLVNLRLAITGDVFTGIQATASYGALEYFVPISILAVLLELARGGKLDRWSVLAVLAAVTYAVLFTGRTIAVMLLVSAVGIRLMRRELSVGRGIAMGAAAFGAVFIGMGLALGKLGVEGVIDVGEVALSYTVASMRALGQVLDFDPDPALGANTLRTLVAVVSRLGAEVTPLSLVQAPAYVPIPTNVYTVFHPYVLDFGRIAAVLLPWFLGLVHGLLYRGAVRRGGMYTAAYALLLFPLAMQVFQDQYLSLLSLWVQCSVVLLLAWGFGGDGARQLSWGGGGPTGTPLATGLPSSGADLVEERAT